MVTTEAERARLSDKGSSTTIGAGGGAGWDISENSSVSTESGVSNHSEVATDVTDGDVSGGGGTSPCVGDVGVGGGALWNGSLEKNSCVREARRRRERDIVPEAAGEGSGESPRT
jgi:hypothetical protein